MRNGEREARARRRQRAAPRQLGRRRSRRRRVRERLRPRARVRYRPLGQLQRVDLGVPLSTRPRRPPRALRRLRATSRAHPRNDLRQHAQDFAEDAGRVHVRGPARGRLPSSAVDELQALHVADVAVGPDAFEVAVPLGARVAELGRRRRHAAAEAPEDLRIGEAFARAWIFAHGRQRDVGAGGRDHATGRRHFAARVRQRRRFAGVRRRQLFDADLRVRRRLGRRRRETGNRRRRVPWPPTFPRRRSPVVAGEHGERNPRNA